MARHSLLHHIVAQRAAQSPDTVAFIENGQRVGYGELEVNAGRLASLLRDHGVRAGRTVALGLPPGSTLATALLAVHKTGAAAVLAAPDAPAERLALLLEDARPDAVITAGTELPVPPGTKHLRLEPGRPDRLAGLAESAEQAEQAEQAEPVEPLEPADEAASPALVAYGRTGTGWVLDAADTARHAGRLAEHYGLTASDVLLLAGPVDDLDLHGVLFAALTTGATVVTAPPADPAAGTEALPHTAAALRATVLTTTPDALRPAADLAAWAEPAELRLVVCHTPGPDPTTAHEVCRLLAGRTRAAVRSLHGAAGRGLPVAAFGHEPGAEATPVPLDRLTGEVRTVVLDESGEPVPPGVPGELHLTGTGTALGFHRRPALTAECFLPDPYGKPGERLHRTGELVRRRNDGTLEHLGRLADAPDQEPPTAPALLLDDDHPPYVEPRTAEERAVAAVWSELLGIDDIGAHDDFFQLGGYSLLLTRLIERLHRSTGKLLDLSGLYTAMTVEQQAELLRDAPAAGRPVEPVARDGALPLSSGQRRLWYLDRARPGSAEWIVPLLLRLPADVPADTVRRALDVLGERHESLRTRYLIQDGEPAQLVEAPSPVELTVLDCPPHDLGAAVVARFEEEFDLEAGRLWRALLLREDGRDQLLFITVHHIACDGWSATVLEREFREICDALHTGRTPELPAPVIQYADYAAWQQRSADEDGHRAGVEFWRRELDGMTVLELPADHPRPAERDPRGGMVAVTVPAPLADELLALGQRHEASPFLTLLAGFAALLARYTGQWDVGVGVPVAGRDRPEVEPVVGFFLNSLVLRCRLDPARGFADALDGVRATGLAAFAHQDVSFDRLVEELRPERDPSRTPLYQVAFNYNDEQVTGGMPGEADHALFLGSRRVAKTDLTLYLRRNADGTLNGVFEYASAVFEHATVERLAGHFVQLLASAAAAPGTGLRDLEILSARERADLLGGWNGMRTAWPAGSVIDLIEAQAAATPDATALVAGPERIGYRELDRAADRIAHRLVALGAGPDRLVGVCLRRGPGLVEALLGVWKAGAAYVPLDPDNPPERLEHILADSGATVLISDSTLTSATEGFTGTRLLLDRAADAADGSADLPAGPPPRHTDPEQLAYVIYTSGSTGRPKGVMVSHRGLANHLRWAARDLVHGEGGAPLFSSVAFDLPATNLYAPLLTGRPVHLLPADLDLGRLGAELAAAGPFSFVKLTPGHLELLTHQLTPQQLDRLAGVVLVAGEALPARTANHWLDALGPGRLVNEYGPTEASIGSTVFPVDKTADAVVPLGGPLPNVTAYVLDATGRPVPVGVPGELHIGGEGVARGYLDRPGLTAAQFVPDPYGPPGSRLYRTGDLVRRLPDGSIDFLGRIDTQVKIRGYRIELGEIEARLTAEPGIRDAVVVVHEARPGEKSLAAFVVPAPDHGFDPGQVRQRLSDALPEYMVPASITAIEAVPLTSNGKLDHRALPAVHESTDAHRPPETPIEERIAGVWATLLDRERIGVEDDFFALGGHSILAIRMTSSLRDEFDIDLSVRSVLENPTVRSLAQVVEALIRAEIEQMTAAELLEAKAREHQA
ncbi:amino acid adenylation domain-containing protein [Kitasatospora sp. NPDC058115]|uniref:amino acid adenylation domain-containing protein n=1 Tax=Kitasatospora sp. NPDC058115 TaxID=3346347 RepID=UPI0036DC14E0